MKTAAALSAFAFLISGICIAETEASPIKEGATRSNSNNHNTVYQLDTGDVIALYYQDASSEQRKCVLHVVQIDGLLHFPFGKVQARGSSIREVRDGLSRFAGQSAEKGMNRILVTVADLRNGKNDQLIRNFH